MHILKRCVVFLLLASPASAGIFHHGGSHGGTGPTNNSVAASNWTVANNALCTAISPFYWEIGNASSVLVSGASGTGYGASTKVSIASASKVIEGAYVVQTRGGASNLTSNDITFLHQASGYTNSKDTCSGATSIYNCLLNVNASSCAGSTNGTGLFAAGTYGAQCPANVGVFSYNGGNFQVHAALYLPSTFYNATIGSLASQVNIALGLTSPNTIVYTEPLTSGGIYANAQTIRVILQKIVGNTLLMHDALGTSTICTKPAANYSNQTVNGVTGPANCPATYSPLSEVFQYSIGHWVESDPAQNGDGAFSSAGAFGFYPWISADKTLYGLISRQGAAGQGDNSLQCGRLIRRAWVTGINQTGTIPTP